MKKLLSLFLTLIITISFLPIITWAKECDGYTYAVVGSTAKISAVSSSVAGDVFIPQELDGYKVVSIGYGVFKGRKDITSIVVPENVVTIASSAFQNCTSLTSVTLPHTLQTLGSYAFESCSNLKNVTIPPSINSIETLTFGNCSKLESIIIPDSVKSIATWTFMGCSKLKNITLPDSVTFIDNEAFIGCKYYETASNWTDGVLYIGNHLIKSDDSLQADYKIKEGTVTIASYAFYRAPFESITIPHSVVAINEYAFSHNTKLSVVNIPDSVKYIDALAFYNTAVYNDENNWIDGLFYIGNHMISANTSISNPCIIRDGTVTIGKSAFGGTYKYVKQVTLPSSVQIISPNAFKNCSSLTLITLSSSLKEIGDNAFSGCTKLTDISIPDSVTYIGDLAFYKCSSLTSVTLPLSMEYLGNTAFKECSDLYYAIIPEGIDTIAYDTFDRCSNMAYIILPSSVTKIEEGAFRICNNLEEVYYMGTESEWNNIEIGAVNTSLTHSAIYYDCDILFSDIAHKITNYVIQDGKITLDIKVANNTKENTDLTTISAIYSKDNILKKCITATYTAPGGYVIQLTIPFDNYTYEDGDYVKLFLWEKGSSLMPAANLKLTTLTNSLT